MKIRFSKGNSFSPVNSEAAHTCNSLPEKSKGSFSQGRTGTCNALPDVQQKEFTIHEAMEFEICEKSELPAKLEIVPLIGMTLGEKINLFDYVRDENNKKINLSGKERRSLKWKVEGVSGLAKLLFSGRLVALQEGKVRVKLLQKKGRVWYNLCIATVQIVRIKLPKIELEYGCTVRGILSNYSPEIEKKWQFNEIKVTFTNEFDKPIRVLNNLDVLLKDWEIFWESPIGEEIEIGVGESKAAYFSTDNTMYDGRDLAKISYTFESGGKTFAVYYDTETEKITFEVFTLIR